MRGFAYTDKPDLPPEEGYTDEAFAEDIRALVAHLGFDKVSIVSHDFGSVWTRRFARAYPQLLDKLVLFQPVHPGIGPRFFTPDRFSEAWYMFFHQLPLAEELVGSSRQTTEAYLRHFLSHWSNDRALWTDEEVARYVEAFSQPGALRGGFNCYRAIFRTLRRPDPIADPKVHAPTLILWAENDPVFPHAWSDNVLDFYPNAELRSVPQCGHFVFREKPEMVNQAIAEFLLGVEAR